MDIWWESLATPERIFWTIALGTSALLVIQLVLSFFGLDADTDVDMDAGAGADLGHGAGAGVLSLRSVTAFFTGFGWGGVVALDAGFSLPAAVVIALACGSFLMACAFFLMRALYSLRYSGTIDYRNAIGVHGNVYLPIPGKMQGVGQVEVLVQGRLRVVQAFTRAEGRIPNRARVKVVDVVDSQTLLVEPLDPLPEPDPTSSTRKEI